MIVSGMFAVPAETDQFFLDMPMNHEQEPLSFIGQKETE
jgi:hypothetical protein